MAERWANAVDTVRDGRLAVVQHRLLVPQEDRGGPEVVYAVPFFTQARGNIPTRTAQAFAARFGGSAHVMSAEAKGFHLNSIRPEGIEVAEQYLRSREERRVDADVPVIVAGQSRGAAVGATTARRLEEEGVTVYGFVPITPRGVSNESPVALAWDSVSEVGQTANYYIRNRRRLQDLDPDLPNTVEMLLFVGELGHGVLDTIKSGRLLRKIYSCSRVNPDTSEIQTHVVAVYGRNDKLASPNKIRPSEKKSLSNDFERELAEYLSRTVFHSAAGVDVLVEEDAGYHAVSVLSASKIVRRVDDALRTMHEPQRQQSGPTQIFPKAA